MLSMKAKYALRALIVLSTNEKKMLQSKVIAKQADVPAKFLETILAELKSENVVDSKRGIFGGYFLKKPAAEIRVGEVIRGLDGTIAPLRCASVSDYQKCEDCQDEATCVIRKVMVEVRNAIATVLDGKTLADMIALSPKQKQNIFW
jgi:Rrf2 family protein